jgi:hypothetical protein
LRRSKRAWTSHRHRVADLNISRSEKSSVDVTRGTLITTLRNVGLSQTLSSYLEWVDKHKS